MAQTTRKSLNFKLPKPLADALRFAAKECNTTATDLVIRGLHNILGGKYKWQFNEKDGLYHPIK